MFGLFTGSPKPSDAASLFKEIFGNNETKTEFLDSLATCFINFDTYNEENNNRVFASDVKHIAQYTSEDITSKNPKAFQRIDAYFYVYYRLAEYIKISKQKDSFLQDYQQKLLEFITKIFTTTEGREPNLSLTDKDLLKQINIFQHLSSIKIKDDQSLCTAFVLFKLSIQASMIIKNDDKYLTWKHMLSSIAEIKIKFEDFIEKYLKYKHVFDKCPLDVPAYIYIIQLQLPLKNSSMSKLNTYLQQSDKLAFDRMTFFREFGPIFDTDVRRDVYKISQINEFLVVLTSYELYFSEYLTSYASNIPYDQLWSTFLSLSRISNLNANMSKYLSVVLVKNISSVSLYSFKQHVRLAKDCVDLLIEEKRPRFVKIFEDFYDAFINKEIRNLARYKESEIKDLINTPPVLLSADRRRKPANSLIIQQLIFRIDPTTLDTAQRLKILFQNIADNNNTILRNAEPNRVLEDEWLKVFLIDIPQGWLKLDQNIYRYLCNYHQNNPWTIHIWSRIVHLSVLKVANDNLSMTLVQLNNWMKSVGHDVYQTNDILTIIFIRNLFEILITTKYKLIGTLPEIDSMIKFAFAIKNNRPNEIDEKKVDEFITCGRQSIETILQLKGIRIAYRKLLTNTVVYCFLPYVDFKKVVSPELYRFPQTSDRIDAIISLPKPRDLNSIIGNSKEEFFNRFIHDVNDWFPYIDRFFNVFQPIIDWLNTYNIDRVHQLASNLSRIKNEPKTTVSQLKTTVEDISKSLSPFNDLQRLCHLFNCLISFRIIEQGTFNNQIPVANFIKELERFLPTNTLLVEGQTIFEQKIPITDHQNVRWSLVSANYPCTIKIEYRTDDSDEASKCLYEKPDAQIQRNVLQGQFETEKNGQLVITIDNRQRQTIQIWYRIRSVNLSTCHLFHGILRMFYERYFHQSNPVITERQFSNLVDETFRFIDKLLSGNLTLRDMKILQTVFFDKNIHIKNEVEKLFTSRSGEQVNQQEIEQVCEWLQVYQYYSHIANIIDCIQKFDILASDTEDETIGRIQGLGGDDDRTLRDITQDYRILQERFQHLTHQHLQLIKTAVECSNVVQMMKKADLYSDQGRSRFQKLRDNLTTQFQLQERNNMILNAWIITYALLDPFMYKVKKFDDFLARIARLVNLDESSLNYIKIVNDNLQIVNMWLSAEDTSVLDNALITMGYLYKNGVVDIHLRHLINEPSFFEIGYSIDRNQDQNQGNEKLKFTMSMSDIDDHKRQLAFCNVDVQQNRFYSKTLIDCQLKLLQKIERIYSILTKLEMSGHPDYQLREERYVIHAYTNQDNPTIVQLEQEAKRRTSTLDDVYERFETSYSKWIQNLERFRDKCFLLKLFSDRQIMILIILLKQSESLTSIRRRFLKKLYSFQNPQQQTDEEQQFTYQCLRHYLSSLRIKQNSDLIDIYDRHKIDAQSDTEICLRKLSSFLDDLFNHGDELMEQRSIIDTDQQYLISLNPKEDHLDMNTFCILINLFNNRLPSSFQILWCTTVQDEDIKLFFSRIRTFRHLVFLIMNIDKMHHRLRETLLNEQDRLTRDQVEHGTVFYFSKELTISRNGLREFHIPQNYRNVDETLKQLTNLYQKNNLAQAIIKIIYGAAGIGKTHRINTQYNNTNLSCFSINDNLNLSSLIRSFLSFNSRSTNINPLIYFNISIHAPFEELNRTLFSLFICGSLMDVENGLVFSLPNNLSWEFIIEVPYSTSSQLTFKENFDHILPLLSIITPKKHLEEVTNNNYQLFIGEDEEIVARFLKAYEDRTIDRLCQIDQNNKDHPVEFLRLTNADECRDRIYNCMNNYAPNLPRNKICQLSFTKFLYRRVLFFLGPFYQMNQVYQQLGTIAMKQMIEEADILTRIDFRDDRNVYRVFLVYGECFSLHILHNDWNGVPQSLKQLFKTDPRLSDEYHGKDYLVECLAWLINIPYKMFETILNEKKFILTENFAYKLFHVHERKLTRLPLIIEGDTGVGKTFLLKFYSALLHAKNTRDHHENVIMPRIGYNMNLWLLTVITEKVENQEVLLRIFVHQTKRKLLGLENNDENNLDPPPQQIDLEFLTQIKKSLGQAEYNEEILYFMWKTLLTISNENHLPMTTDLIEGFYNYVSKQLTDYPLIESRMTLKELLQITESPTIQLSMDLCQEFLFHCPMKPIFYRLLLHPGITEEQIFEFMIPIMELANELSTIELVVFFDEVNTSSCLGLFKEMFMDGTLHGRRIPKNIFFTAAINPYIENKDQTRIHRNDFNVYKLPESLENLVVPYGALPADTLGDYIARKIAMFQINSTTNGGRSMPLEGYVQQTLAQCILVAQKFCEERLGANTVSQREIQRCFSLIEFFWRMRYDNEIENGQIVSDPNPIRCIALPLALIYYFRLPTKEHIEQEKLKNMPSREELAEILSRFIPEFDILIQKELDTFVNTNNFVIPAGVAINQAVREHIFSIVVSIATRTPLCIIGVPGQSKTLSFQIVIQNLQGPQLSPKAFCKRLPAVDPFYCLGSKYTQSDDIAYVFERAIKREQHYEQNGIDTRCVVFLDEASLPDEKKMVLKVLHPYLDDCKVAFVAIANQSFDAANANRMICIYRSLPSKDDQKILAYGCLGLQTNQNQFDDLITGLCQGYRRILQSPDIRRIFHDRDFIYMLRELRFDLTSTNEEQALSIGEITPQNFLRALEDNFNGITQDEFHRLVQIFFEEIQRKCPNFALTNEIISRDIPTILRQSMKLDSKRRKLYGRYKLIIDESEDESAVQLLFQSGILSSDPEQTTIFRMADFSDDIDNELRNVEILSTIKLCMETGKTILMVNTGRIHGSLYDVFNQNFSIMATDETRKIFSKVAIGPKTMDVVVHENFQCLVLMKRSEFDETPAPFLSRFQKYIFDVQNFYSIQFKQLSRQDQILMRYVKERVLSFVQHFGQQYFYGYNKSTIYSCLLSLIEKDENGQYYLANIHEKYSQLTIKSKSFIEQNSANNQECILYYLLSQLIQLVSPESMIYKLRTFEEDFARLLYKNYFHQQEHFDIENFIQQILSFSANDDIENEENRNITTKFMLFTRTSAFVTNLNENSKEDLFKNADRIDILKLSTIENSAILNEHVQTYVEHAEQQVLIIIIDGRIRQQRQHIPFIRQLIDKTDQSSNKPNKLPQKYFLILIHSTNQELNHQLCFPSIFLHHWDYYFLDTSASGSAFHLQKILQTLTSTYHTPDQDQLENINANVCDYNRLFNDCLWDFCSRLQISFPNLSSIMFSNPSVREFYQRETSTVRRVGCLKEILQQSRELEQRIVNIYYENMTINQKTFEKMKDSIYELTKDVLCGKRTNSLVDSLQSQIRTTFTNFISNILKHIVNDYGLETLSKLSDHEYGYEVLLNLIDYSSFASNEENENDSSISNRGTLSLANHYSCIPQTPLYHLFYQRIKTLAEQIKPNMVSKRENNSFEIQTPDDLFENDYIEAPTTMGFNQYTTMNDNVVEQIEYTSEQFRDQLIESMLNDKTLVEIVSEPILKSYTNDTVQTVCTVVEKNFRNNNENPEQYQNTIEFVANWLLLIDENDQRSIENSSNSNIWRLAHVYTFFEYNHNDLYSLYSACRIMDQLDPTQSFHENLIKNRQCTRSSVRENLFSLMFNYLWRNLCDLCSNNDQSPQSWIQIYTFVSKYYPSDKVLEHQRLIDVKGQIEFMNLAYLIFLNNQTPDPKQLVLQLLKDTSLIDDDPNRGYQNYGTSVCLRLLTPILNTIQRTLENNSTLMIDVQQWILSIVKSSNEKEIKILLEFLDQPTCSLSLSMKQFLFDELMNLLFTLKRQNRIGLVKQNADVWERTILLLPAIVECVREPNLQTYQLPYHPSVITNENQKQVLFDLFFFHLRRIANEELINSQLLNKIFMSSPPATNERRFQPIIEKVFLQLKDFFSITMTALLFSEKDVDNYDQQRLNQILDSTIRKYLSINPPPVVQLSQNLELFLSTIIAKRSWNYLLNLLKSERFQLINGQWSNTLHSLLDIQTQAQQNRSLQICHRLQFTITTNQTLSIFPKLHQPYDELSKLVFQCSRTNDAQRWKPLTDWITLKLTSNPPALTVTEIKVMLLLNIYYDFYCTNQLASLENLISVIETSLQPIEEELRVFRAFLQPEQSMIGYPGGNNNNNNANNNQLNNLFKLDCQDEDELSIRHALVNLLAMILLAGQQNFLWAFTFKPLTLTNTFGFGSKLANPIQANGVHYDCGCVILETGDLLYAGDKGGALSVPAAYVAYFSTFGAMAWHLLLYNESVDNLYHPILAKHAIDDTSAICRIVGDSIRAKVCHFVRARLLSTYSFLSIRTNESDACMLLNRCFEQLTNLTKPQNAWIQTVYTTNDNKIKAEQEYQNLVFYPTDQQIVEYKKFINNLYLQSQVQKKLQEYVSEMSILVQFQHFKTELCNPKNGNLPLNILRQILDSFAFLRMTPSIYDLGQFYLLLHHTYTQLVNRKEFTEISLRQLYERGQKRQKNSTRLNLLNRTDPHLTVIENGIKAVNAYHSFADGLIRPGACDETQRFVSISIDTPISYLLTTGEHDEGDIIMRILSVLIDYHNNMLDFLGKQINSINETTDINLLKELINQFSTKELSLFQILQENTGVMSINDQERSVIESLARSSLDNNNEYFLKADTPLNFKFLYIQYYLLRSYFLLCQINYKQFSEQYRCFIEQDLTLSVSRNKSKYQVNDPEFNYLQKMSLEKLYQGYKFLQGFANISKTDVKNLTFHEFLRQTDNSDEFFKQIKYHEIKDFQLSEIDNICQIYEQLIDTYHDSILKSSHSLRLPISPQFDQELEQFLDMTLIQSNMSSNSKDLQTTIQAITTFLDELKGIEETLGQMASHPLMEIYRAIYMNEDSVFNLIPNEVKCENYIAVVIKLIEIRSKLQEKTIQMEEKIDDIWRPIVTEQQQLATDSHSPFDLRPKEINVDPIPLPKRLLDPPYTILFELNFTSILLTSSIVSKQINDPSFQTEEEWHFMVTFIDETTEKYTCEIENILEKLKAVLQKKSYDFKQFGIIDKNHLFIDLTIENNRKSCLSEEYFVVQKNSLVSINIEFDEQEKTYFAAEDSQISSIIHRFLRDQNISIDFEEFTLGVFDQFGVFINENQSIQNYNRLKLVKYDIQQAKVSKLTLVTKDDIEMFASKKEIIQIFDRNTTWKQISLWMKSENLLQDIPFEDLKFWNRENGEILDEEQMISSVSYEFESVTIDCFTRETLIKVLLSYNTRQETIQLFKSIPVNRIIAYSNLTSHLSLADSILLLVKEDRTEKLVDKQLKKSIGDFLTDDNNDEQSLHFQIQILIKLIQYENQEEIEMTISSKNLTIKQLLDQVNLDDNHRRYLASEKTQMILSEEEKLSNQDSMKFLLVKQDQILEISIGQNHTENAIHQRYIVDSILRNIYQQNEEIIQDQYLVYKNNFILSPKTSLTIFGQDPSPIKFTLSNRNFPIETTIVDEEQNISLRFQCLSSTTSNDIRQLSYQLFNTNNNRYLVYDNELVLPNEISLRSLLQETTSVHFTLTSQKSFVKVTINDDAAQFQCLPTVSLQRIKQVACQFLSINENQYLVYRTNFILSEETTLTTLLNKTSSTINFTLISQANVTGVIVIDDEGNTSIQFQCLPSVTLRDIKHFSSELLSITEDRQLIYENKFILAEEISVSHLRSTSPIRFALSDREFPLNIIVSDEEHDILVEFQCFSSISLENLKQFSCQFLNGNGNLVYENDFVLSQELFNLLVQEISSIRFNLINRPYLANITISKDEHPSIYFQCLSSISFDRLRQFACQIFHLTTEEYRLKFLDQYIQQYEVSLADITQTFDDVQLQLIECLKGCEPLFQLDIQSVALTTTNLFEKIRDKKQNVDNSSKTVKKAVRIGIVYPDKTQQSTIVPMSKIYSKLQTTCQEGRYKFDKYSIVDEDKIFVDVSNESSPIHISTEYHIVEKDALISVILQFESEQMQYLTTSDCQISSVITRFLIDKKITLSSNEIFFGIFDQLRLYIVEDQPILQIYRSNTTDPLQIKLIQYEDNTNKLCQVSFTSKQDDPQTRLFHPLTKLEQIHLWLQTSSQTCSFYDREQNIILDENQFISTTSSTIDGVSNDEISTVRLSYERNTEAIRILKSTCISDLLHNEHYLQRLHVRISSNDCILVRVTEDNIEILTEEELKQPVQNYVSSDNFDGRFRIATLVQIIQYDIDRLYSIPVPSRNITIAELIELIPNRNEIYQYLSSFDTHLILSNDHILSNLTETKFHLIKRTEILLIAINLSQQISNQSYTSFATIADIYKQNKHIIANRHLLFNTNIALSPDTPLTYFQHVQSPIQFTLSREYQNLPAYVTITNDEEQELILKFRCSLSITVEYLIQLACDLFNLQARFYQLNDVKQTNFDESLDLEDAISSSDAIESSDDIQLKLVSKAKVKCSIIYNEQTVIIPVDDEATRLSTVLEDTLAKLRIPSERMNNYKFFIFDTPENRLEIDIDTDISDILEMFSIEKDNIKLHLIEQ